MISWTLAVLIYGASPAMPPATITIPGLLDHATCKAVGRDIVGQSPPVYRERATIVCTPVVK